MGGSQLHTYLAAQLSGLAARKLIAPGDPLCLAVSGGPDSMAMAQLFLDVAGPHHPLHVLTVDHGLRPEAADEAAMVAAWANQNGLSHQTLVWQQTGDEGANNNQHEQARMARYALMADWCVAHDVAHIITAHHLDDQAETVLMRLGRGSGVDGLGAIRGMQRLMTADLCELTLLRPMLGVPKKALEQFAKQRGLPTVDDPSNKAARYMRSRHRHFLQGQEAEALGLTAGRLADTARVMQRAADALDAAVTALVAQVVTANDLGYLRVALAALLDAQDEVRLRALRLLLHAMNPGSFPVEEAQLLRLWRWIKGEGEDAAIPRYTIRGLLLEKSGAKADQCLFVMREPRAIAPARALVGDAFLWDGRYAVRGGAADAGMSIVPAAQIGINTLRDQLPSDVARLLDTAPPMARGTVPILARMSDHGMVALDLLVNQAGFGREDAQNLGVEAHFAPRLMAKPPLFLPELPDFGGESPGN